MIYEGNHKLGDFFTSRRERGTLGLPMLSVTMNNGVVMRESLDRKMETNLSDEEHLLVRKDDIVYNMMRMWQGASGLADRDGLLSPAYIVLAPKKGIDPLYASYLFKSSRLIYLLWAYSYGLTSDRLRLYFNDFKRIPVNIPSLIEQQKIGKILSTWDKSIDVTEQLLANSQKQKNALMQQLLTKKRPFTGFDADWKEVKLSSLCEVRRGASPRPIDDKKWFAQSGRGWVRISDVTASSTHHLIKTTQYLSDAGVEKSVSVNPGDLIMSICGTIGVPKFLDIPACIHDGFVVFRNTEKNLSLNFLYYFLEFVSGRLASGGQPGTQKNLNTTIVGNLLIPKISLEEQEKIITVLSLADQQVWKLQELVIHLKAQKKALMQQLLTGNAA